MNECYTFLINYLDYFSAKEWESLYQPEPLTKMIEDIRLAEEAVIHKRKECKKSVKSYKRRGEISHHYV